VCFGFAAAALVSVWAALGLATASLSTVGGAALTGAGAGAAGAKGSKVSMSSLDAFGGDAAAAAAGTGADGAGTVCGTALVASGSKSMRIPPPASLDAVAAAE